MHSITFDGKIPLIPKDQKVTEILFTNFYKAEELNQAIARAAKIKTLTSLRFVDCTHTFSLKPFFKCNVTNLDFLSAGSDQVLSNLPPTICTIHLSDGFTNEGLKNLYRLKKLILVHGSSKQITGPGLIRLGKHANLSLSLRRGKIFVLS